MKVNVTTSLPKIIGKFLLAETILSNNNHKTSEK